MKTALAPIADRIAKKLDSDTPVGLIYNAIDIDTAGQLGYIQTTIVSDMIIARLKKKGEK